MDNTRTFETFMHRLHDIRASLLYVLQSAEVSVLVNCDCYERRVNLTDALSAIQSAIDAWSNCRHEVNCQYRNLAWQESHPITEIDNSELLRTLKEKELLSVVELLSFALKYPDDDLDEFDCHSGGYLSSEVFEYSKKLTDYQRLKLMQLIINTLIHEAEQSTVQHFQTLLPLKAEEFYRP
jgi:hypothetical protein